MKTSISYLLAFIIILLFTSSISMAQQSIANVPVTVKLQAGNVLIAQCVTNEKGEFTFDFQEGLPAPASGTFIFEITIPQQPGQNINLGTKSAQSIQTLTSNFTVKTPRPFVYILKLNTVKGNKGVFAVSGRNTA